MGRPGRPKKEQKQSYSYTTTKPERMDNFIMHIPVGFANRKHIGQIAVSAEAINQKVGDFRG